MLPDSTTGWPSESDRVQEREGGRREKEAGGGERERDIQQQTNRERGWNLKKKKLAFECEC